ncbi:hypothetical protein N7540_004735 [Penicillium herquei]|nr:hypothetical protein N7540_004735 [Penicillium herquei]
MAEYTTLPEPPIWCRMFIQFLFYSDRRVSLGIIYTIYLLISVIPLFIGAVSKFDDPDEMLDPAKLLAAVFFAFHSMILWPIISILGCLSIYLQAGKIFKEPFPSSLSFQGLLLQATVFLIGAIVWVWSLAFPYKEAKGHWNWSVFSIWYSTIGWVIVNTLIFALGQALLCVLLSRRTPSDDEITPSGETEPLLG